jgi:tRNA G37 N-methylase TrmD
MNTIIYYIVGILDQDKFEIKVTELKVKETAKSFKVIDSNGASIWVKRLVPHVLVETASINEQWRNNFNDVRFEAYCHPRKVDETILSIKDKISEYHHRNVNTFKKVVESFKTCLIIKDNSTTTVWSL